MPKSYTAIEQLSTEVWFLPHIFLLSFPADGLLREKWIKVTRRQRNDDTWQPTKYSQVCSDHFHQSDIRVSKMGKKLLNKTALPHFIQDQPMERPDTPQNAEVSDLDSVFDSPRKAFLERKVSKLREEKEKIQKSRLSFKRKINIY